MDKASRPDPKAALNLLREGNRRFISGILEQPNRDYQRLRDLARGGQQPYAAFVACSDSRLPLEIMFDCGFGDIFCIRTAGNTFSPSVLGAVEFAVTYFDIPLLVVMGHSDCGAVAVVVGGGPVSSSIEPAIATIRDAAKRISGAAGPNQAEAVATANIWLTVERLIERSAPLQDRLRSGQTGIAAAMCNTASAKVHWLQQTAASGR